MAAEPTQNLRLEADSELNILNQGSNIEFWIRNVVFPITNLIKD